MPDLTVKKSRPLWVDINLLHLPLPGMLSIFHRASGALMFLGLIWFLFLLDLSLSSEAGFAHFSRYVSHPLVKLVFLGYIWAYLHHFCAGIRYLFLDIDKGVDLVSARRSSWAVFIVSIVLTLVLGAKLW